MIRCHTVTLLPTSLSQMLRQKWPDINAFKCGIGKLNSAVELRCTASNYGHLQPRPLDA